MNATEICLTFLPWQISIARVLLAFQQQWSFRGTPYNLHDPRVAEVIQHIWRKVFISIVCPYREQYSSMIFFPKLMEHRGLFFSSVRSSLRYDMLESQCHNSHSKTLRVSMQFKETSNAITVSFSLFSYNCI